MGDEKVKCMICGLESEYSISGNHLRLHKISLPEYQKQFPDAKIVTEEYDKRMKDLYINKPKIKEKEETKKEVKISFNFDMPPDKARVITYIATLFGIDLVLKPPLEISFSIPI